MPMGSCCSNDYAVGEQLYLCGELDEAIIALTRSIEKKKMVWHATRLIGKILYRQDKPEAVGFLEKSDQCRELGYIFLEGRCEQKINLRTSLRHFNRYRESYQYKKHMANIGFNNKVSYCIRHVNLVRDISLHINAKCSPDNINGDIRETRRHVFKQALLNHDNKNFARSTYLFTLLSNTKYIPAKSMADRVLQYSLDKMYYLSKYIMSMYHVYNFKHSGSLYDLKKSIIGFNISKKHVFDSEIQLSKIKELIQEKKISPFFLSEQKEDIALVEETTNEDLWYPGLDEIKIDMNDYDLFVRDTFNLIEEDTKSN